MLQALVARAVDTLREFRPLDFSLTMWACATLGHRDVEWLRAVVRVRPDFAEFSPQQLANFSWGAASLGFRNENLFLALGRDAVAKLPHFKPQELSNYVWALATVDLVDNLSLLHVSEEIQRRGATELMTWDPQSLANIMWAYAALAVKDDALFELLVGAALARIAEFNSQELSNSTWATAMVLFRHSGWLSAVSARVACLAAQMAPMHLAQVAWALSRFHFHGGDTRVLPVLAAEALRRCDEFPHQSLIDVQDALGFFDAAPPRPNAVEERLDRLCRHLEARLRAFAEACGDARAGAAGHTKAQAAAYRAELEALDLVTLGARRTAQLLRAFSLGEEPLGEADGFAREARVAIAAWRARLAAADPTGRAAFHRSQCVWQLVGAGGDGVAGGLLASASAAGATGGLVACRLRHARGGDAEFRAMAAAAELLESAPSASGIGAAVELRLHVSEVPCVSCVGAMVQLRFRCPGMGFCVTFDRGREAWEDSPPQPSGPPKPRRLPELAQAGLDGAAAQQLYAGGALPAAPSVCKVQRAAAELAEHGACGAASFYSGGGGARRALAEPGRGARHRILGGRQSFYPNRQPIFMEAAEYDEFQCA